jgi:hypothetical protein
MSKGRAYNRDVSLRKALRKKRISDHFWSNCPPYYNNLHQYSKNKIHCSCPLCSQKTKNKGKRKKKNYNPTHNYKASDLRKKVAMDLQEKEMDL